jgi:cation diffusion facilitator family transporter
MNQPGARPDPLTAAIRDRAIRNVLLIEGLSDILFLVVKSIVGLQTGSSAVLSDALHSLTDLSNNIVGLMFLRVAHAPPDREHPYGHHKFESLAVFAIGVLITSMAVQVVLRAFTRGDAEVKHNDLGLALMLLVFIVNIGFTAWEHRQARLLDSELLRADAKHTLADVALTIAVIAGWQLAAAGHVWIDTLFALGVAGFVGWLAWSLFRRSVPVLVDRIVADPDELSAIVRPVAGVAGIRRIRSHQAGSEMVIDIVLSVEGAMSTADSHAVADEVEAAVQRRFIGAQVNVHIEPAEHG